MIKQIKSSVGAYPDQAEIAVSPDDSKRLQNENKYAIYMGMENGYPIGTDLDNLDLFYQLGVRYVTLSHTSNNEICDSSTDTSEFGGLSQFGFEVVERMNQLGMMVDISHVSDATVEDVLKVTQAPVIASHSCAKALCDHPRNLNDKLLAEIAANGGVIQVTFFSDYVKTPVSYPARDSALAVLDSKLGDRSAMSGRQIGQYHKARAELGKEFPRILPTVVDFVNHIDHIVKVPGIDHVGIGSDFDGGGGLEDCYDVSEMPNATKELLKRGYSKSDISKIWSGNLLRVFHEVEQVAESLKLKM